jgi:hydroxyacyl-ACP dehydratase HTD2-like protein with hotdog domain
MISAHEAAEQARRLTTGSALPALVRTPTRVTCFLFAVAWWTPHRVHYDVEWAREEGYEDLMVPGLLINEYVVTAVTSWTGDPSNLRRLTIRNTGPAFAGDTVTVAGEVAEAVRQEDRTVITFDFTVVKQGDQPVATGRATVEVPDPIDR